jgi:hypothetical protein
MQTRHLFSALAIATLTLSASAAFAADGCRTIANGVQKCDMPSSNEPAANVVQAKADSTGCRTIANGVQKCDLPTTNSDNVASTVRDQHAYTIDGCRTIANGVQKCDVPSARSGNTAVAKLH